MSEAVGVLAEPVALGVAERRSWGHLEDHDLGIGRRGDNGAVRVQAPPEGESQRQTTDAPVLPQIVVSGEHYGRLLRLLDKKVPVALEIDVKNRRATSTSADRSK